MYIGKEEVQLALFEDCDPVCRKWQWVFKTISRSTPLLSGAQNTGQYKTECTLVATNNSKLEIMVLRFTIASKIWIMKSTKHCWESQDNLNKWSAVLHSRIRKLSIVRMLIIHNLIYRLNAVLHRNPSRLFVPDHLIFKFTWKCIQLSSQNNSEKNKVENWHKYKTDCDSGLWIMNRLVGQK